jgi:hypothetical protein
MPFSKYAFLIWVSSSPVVSYLRCLSHLSYLTRTDGTGTVRFRQVGSHEFTLLYLSRLGASGRVEKSHLSGQTQFTPPSLERTQLQLSPPGIEPPPFAEDRFLTGGIVDSDLDAWI